MARMIQVTSGLPSHSREGSGWHQGSNTQCHSQLRGGRIRAKASLMPYLLASSYRSVRHSRNVLPQRVGLEAQYCLQHRGAAWRQECLVQLQRRVTVYAVTATLDIVRESLRAGPPAAQNCTLFACAVSKRLQAATLTRHSSICSQSFMPLCLQAPGIVRSLIAYSRAPSRPTCSFLTRNSGNVRRSLAKRAPSSRNAAASPPSSMRFNNCGRASHDQLQAAAGVCWGFDWVG